MAKSNDTWSNRAEIHMRGWLHNKEQEQLAALRQAVQEDGDWTEGQD